jgi:hypothetical protein
MMRLCPGFQITSLTELQGRILQRPAREAREIAAISALRADPRPSG